MSHRVLTVKQPWADLIMADDGAGGCLKPVENRTWPVPTTLPQWGRCQACGVRVWPSRWIENGVPTDRFEFMWAGVECRRGCGGMFAADGPFPFRLWIHAGKIEASDLPPWLNDVTSNLDPSLLPRWNQLGALLGSVEVNGCHHADECVQPPYTPGPWSYCSRWAESGVWHWTLTDPRPLADPIPARGRQGLWTLPDTIAQEAAHG